MSFVPGIECNARAFPLRIGIGTKRSEFRIELCREGVRDPLKSLKGPVFLVEISH